LETDLYGRLGSSFFADYIRSFSGTYWFHLLAPYGVLFYFLVKVSDSSLELRIGVVDIIGLGV